MLRSDFPDVLQQITNRYILVQPLGQLQAQIPTLDIDEVNDAGMA